jgi:hypothetical protein
MSYATRLTILVCCVATTALSSCQWWDKDIVPQSDYIPPSTQYANELAIRPTVEDRPVKTGSLPLAYLLDYPGDVRVVDATAGRVLLSTRVGGRTIVSLDAESGIHIGGRIVSPVRLVPAHVYEIYLSQGGENLNRNVYQRR